MLSNKSNKELVEAGHQFAKALDADMPLTEIAKLVSALATRLDCAIVRGDELQQKLDDLAAEAGYLRNAIKQHSESTHFCEVCGKDDPCKNDDVCWTLNHELPATDTYLNSVRAEGVDMFSAHQRAMIGKPHKNDATTSYASRCATEFAEQLRSGNHDTADKAEGIKPDSLTALPVERDQYGYWSHPDYLAFCDGREYIPTEEFNQWMKAKGLEWKVDYRDEEETDYDADGYDLSTWNPEAPAGDGWFVGSIHDTDDGAVCIWLRAKAGV